ncbi:hypothetical protein ElyMa_004633100 [Elysia marginata]|uniref:Uncharacterized protein n=1 Tax=Elysia marginata TaxID=1093978 RepID=A0AAV4I4A6_9GAST|nr:hypothetical protein ElyMa_004633100 [Elysia marginata]
MSQENEANNNTADANNARVSSSSSGSSDEEAKQPIRTRSTSKDYASSKDNASHGSGSSEEERGEPPRTISTLKEQPSFKKEASQGEFDPKTSFGRSRLVSDVIMDKVRLRSNGLVQFDDNADAEVCVIWDDEDDDKGKNSFGQFAHDLGEVLHHNIDLLESWTSDEYSEESTDEHESSEAEDRPENIHPSGFDSIPDSNFGYRDKGEIAYTREIRNEYGKVYRRVNYDQNAQVVNELIADDSNEKFSCIEYNGTGEKLIIVQYDNDGNELGRIDFLQKKAHGKIKKTILGDIIRKRIMSEKSLLSSTTSKETHEPRQILSDQAFPSHVGSASSCRARESALFEPCRSDLFDAFHPNMVTESESESYTDLQYVDWVRREESLFFGSQPSTENLDEEERPFTETQRLTQGRSFIDNTERPKVTISHENTDGHEAERTYTLRHEVIASEEGIEGHEGAASYENTESPGVATSDGTTKESHGATASHENVENHKRLKSNGRKESHGVIARNQTKGIRGPDGKIQSKEKKDKVKERKVGRKSRGYRNSIESGTGKELAMTQSPENEHEVSGATSFVENQKVVSSATPSGSHPKVVSSATPSVSHPKVVSSATPSVSHSKVVSSATPSVSQPKVVFSPTSKESQQRASRLEKKKVSRMLSIDSIGVRSTVEHLPGLTQGRQTGIKASEKADVNQYLASHGIYDLLQFMMSHLLHTQPEKPIDYLIDMTRTINKNLKIRRSVANSLILGKNVTVP